MPIVASETSRPPLRRKPKELTGAPAVFEAMGGGAEGVVLVRSDGPSERHPPSRRKAGITTLTDEHGELEDAITLPVSDSSVRAAAREIASRLIIRRPQPDSAIRRGTGTLRSVPYNGDSSEIDMDATVEALAARPLLEDSDIIVRERIQVQRSVVLAVDVSGSMREERLHTAAAAVGALAGELPVGDLAVISFWSDAAWLSHFGAATDPWHLLDVLVGLPAKGLTNVALPLELAGHELAGRVPRDARVILLSDCLHNAGPDPRPLAARLPRLDVLLDEFGEKDLDLGRQLARSGRGRLRCVRTHRDVAGAISAIFAP